MTQVNQDFGDLARMITPVINAVPHLWQGIEQRDATIAVLVSRNATLEKELAEVRERLIKAEEAKDLSEREAERWYHESMRLEAKLP